MTMRPLLGCLAAALLVAGSAAAQPAPGTPADAEAAAVRLVEATRTRDWAALAAFVDPEDVAEMAETFRDEFGGIEAEIRDELAADGIDADSLIAAFRASSPDAVSEAYPEFSAMLRLSDLLRPIGADTSLGGQVLVARVLSVVARCAPDLDLFNGVVYAPVRADVRTDGAVEAIGRVVGTVGEEPVEGLMVTPLRWTDGRWTVGGVTPEARDADISPIAEALATDPSNWMLGLLYALQAEVEGVGCTR